MTSCSFRGFYEKEHGNVSSDGKNEISAQIMGVSEETTSAVHRLYTMWKKKELQFPTLNLNDSVTSMEAGTFCRTASCEQWA